MIESAEISLGAQRFRECNETLHSFRGGISTGKQLERVLDGLEQTCHTLEEGLYRNANDDLPNPFREPLKNLRQRMLLEKTEWMVC